MGSPGFIQSAFSYEMCLWRRAVGWCDGEGRPLGADRRIIRHQELRGLGDGESRVGGWRVREKIPLLREAASDHPGAGRAWAPLGWLHGHAQSLIGRERLRGLQN